MSSSVVLRKTQKQRDLVGLSLCYSLYKLCNAWLFESMEGSTFVNFLNLRDTSLITVRKKEKTRVCYLIHKVADHLNDLCLAGDWKEEMLRICDIDPCFYKSHYLDPESSDAKLNKLFCNRLKEAFAFAKSIDD